MVISLPPVRGHAGTTLRAAAEHARVTANTSSFRPGTSRAQAASHADPRSTIRYDRARGSLDRHATYIVAAYAAGAAGNGIPAEATPAAGGQLSGRSCPHDADVTHGDSGRTRTAVVTPWRPVGMAARGAPKRIFGARLMCVLEITVLGRAREDGWPGLRLHRGAPVCRSWAGIPHCAGCARVRRARLFVVVAVLRGPSPLESPVNLVGFRVPPLAHPVLETGEQHDRDWVGGGRGDRADNDLRVGGDERGLRRDRRGDDLHRICIGTRHESHCTTHTYGCDLAYICFITPIEAL